MNPTIQKLPFRGSPQTVAVIIKSAIEAQNHYIVRQLVEEICKDIRSKDYLSEILAIGHFVSSKTRYMRDPLTVELVKAPWIVIKEIYDGGTPNLDCDDMTALLAALLLSVGCRVRVVTAAFKNTFYKGQRQYSHVFVQAYEPKTKTWITVDPVAGEKTKSMHNRIVAAKIYNLR